MRAFAVGFLDVLLFSGLGWITDSKFIYFLGWIGGLLCSLVFLYGFILGIKATFSFFTGER
jgi:hypothetical protein